MFPISSRRCTGRGAAANAGGEGGRGEGGRLRERRTIFLVGLLHARFPCAAADNHPFPPNKSPAPGATPGPPPSLARSLAGRKRKRLHRSELHADRHPRAPSEPLPPPLQASIGGSPVVPWAARCGQGRRGWILLSSQAHVVRLSPQDLPETPIKASVEREAAEGVHLSRRRARSRRGLRPRC